MDPLQVCIAHRMCGVVKYCLHNLPQLLHHGFQDWSTCLNILLLSQLGACSMLLEPGLD